MTKRDTTHPSVEAAVKACYSTWSSRYYEDYYGAGAAYPPVHRELLKRLLREHGARSVLDAGCGPASFLRELAGEGLDLYGFDLTPEMVAEARRVLAEQGVAGDHLWEGSVLDAGAFRRPGAMQSSAPAFEAAVCIGVLPHIPPEADTAVIANLRDATAPGGLVVVEARNGLFALFTLNRYSYEFFRYELIRAGPLAQRLPGEQAETERAGLAAALASLQQQFRMDLPPVRRGSQGEPGYDEVLSRAHNPLLLRQQFAAAGLQDVRLLFYHYHCLPPMLQEQVPELFLRESLAMEDAEDWRGHFMASAFLVAGTVPDRRTGDRNGL